MEDSCKGCKLKEECDEFQDLDDVCPYFEKDEEDWYTKWMRSLPRLREIFDSHEITVIQPYIGGEGEFLFRQKDKWMYGMHIIFRKGTIIVYGDIRPCVILSQTGMDLSWLRGSVNNPNYLMEKTITNHKHEWGEENSWVLVAGLQMFVEALDKMDGGE